MAVKQRKESVTASTQRRLNLESKGSYAYLRDKDNVGRRNRDRFAFVVDRKDTVFGVVLIILIIFSLFSILSDDKVLNFEALLNLFKDAPNIDLGWLQLGKITLGDWGILNGMRDFFLMILGVFDILSFIATALFQVVLYLLYFLKVLLL